MPDIFLDLRRIDYVSDQNVPVSAWRAYAEALFVTAGGATVPFSCVVDSGAPFSVLPFSLWHGRTVQWTPLGQQLTRQAGQAPEPLEWQGVACDLGESAVHLIDWPTRVQAGPFLVVAKFARRRLPLAHLETIALLGMNFLMDNGLRLVLDGSGAALAGYYFVP